METPQNLEPAKAEQPKKPLRTRGDKLFDRWVYGGLNGVGTFILTIPFADWAKHGAGYKTFDKIGNKLEKFGLSAKNADNVVVTTALGIGGTVMVLPVWFAEHYRKPIVEWFNKRSPHESDRQAIVENPAPQTFGSLIKGRVVAWLAVFSGFKVVEWGSKLGGKPEMLGNFETKFGEKVCKVIGKETHDTTKRAALEAAGKSVEEALKGSETRAFRYGKLGALDVFATTAATSILYVTSRMFAKKQAKHVEQSYHATPTAANAITANELPNVITNTALQDAPAKTIAGEKVAAGVIAQDAQLQAAQL